MVMGREANGSAPGWQRFHHTISWQQRGIDMAHEVVIPEERIESAILLLRGHRVMLSGSLAKLYGVAPRLACRR